MKKSASRVISSSAKRVSGVSLSEDMWDWLGRVADAEDRTRNYIVGQCVKEAMERHGTIESRRSQIGERKES